MHIVGSISSTQISLFGKLPLLIPHSFIISERRCRNFRPSHAYQFAGVLVGGGSCFFSMIHQNLKDGAPKIAKLPYFSGFMVYKPTYVWGAPSCSSKLRFLNHLREKVKTIKNLREILRRRTSSDTSICIYQRFLRGETHNTGIQNIIPSS